MNRFCTILLLVPVTSLTVACGSAGSTNRRQLQSIAVTQTANGQQIEFVATGNFSSSPTTVTSIPVEWSVQVMAPPPQSYTLTSQPFLFECTASGPFPIVAYAPSDPNAPLTGSWSSTKMVQASTVVTCPATLPAQGPQPYPNAVTDGLIHQETPMLPPSKNVVFTDPDFGSSMVRATDSDTNFKFPGTALRTEGSGVANEWSADTHKFYVIDKGGRDFVFAFDPATMGISSLPGVTPGQGLILPLRPGPSFGFVDPDLIYGTAEPDTLTITSYRFSTGVTTPVINTRNCGVQPPLGSGRSVVSDDDVTLSLDDSRFSISEGGSEGGKHMYVIVYDKSLGCRWYNTQTGQIGGQWGASGTASVTTPYLIRHAYLSRGGNSVVILVDWFGWYVWDLSTLTVSACPTHSNVDECSGYKAVGYESLVNGPGITGDMQTAKRSLSNIHQISQLVSPVLYDWGQEQHFTWSNVDVKDSAPVCGSTYSYDGDTAIDQPFAGEIYCIETDGLASTVWRFAHNRAIYIAPFFQTQPLGSVSRDGHFLVFTSDWDAQLGTGSDGTPRSDAFIVKLE